MTIQYQPPPARDRLPTLPEDLSEYAWQNTGPESWSAALAGIAVDDADVVDVADVFGADDDADDDDDIDDSRVPTPSPSSACALLSACTPPPLPFMPPYSMPPLPSPPSSSVPPPLSQHHDEYVVELSSTDIELVEPIEPDDVDRHVIGEIDEITAGLLIDLWHSDVPMFVTDERALIEEEREAHVISLMDGKATVGALLETSGLPVPDVLGVLCELCARGVVTLDRTHRLAK